VNYLVSGERGFLLSSVIGELDGEIIPYEQGKSYRNIDYVLHFASPSDRYDFEDKRTMANTMVDYSMSIVQECNRNNAKFIFASSEAAGVMTNEYGVYKRFLEQYIQATVYDYLIYRIPRVYGSDRKKGLMKQLRLDDVPPMDMFKRVEYIHISDFKTWFINNLTKHGIICYNSEYRNNTIQEIRDLYT
jgi:nucleoside-diphosphate-sugar epimerase